MLLNFRFCPKIRVVFSLTPLLIHRRTISQSYYDVLKVSPNCSSKEIRDAFIHLSKKNHPDKHLNDPSMHEKFVQLNEAYSTLINPSKRRAYDLTLYHKRKLNPPYDRPFTERRSSTYSDTFHSESSRQSSYTSGNESDYYKDPFSWKGEKFSQRPQYPPKRYSNSTIVGLLITFSIFGLVIQMLAIRRSFLSNQDQMVEKSREYGQIHSLAREKARLYGNAHQIDVLKNNLMPFEVEVVVEPNSTEGVTEEVIIPLTTPKGKNEMPTKCHHHSNIADKVCPKHQHKTTHSAKTPKIPENPPSVLQNSKNEMHRMCHHHENHDSKLPCSKHQHEEGCAMNHPESNNPVVSNVKICEKCHKKK